MTDMSPMTIVAESGASKTDWMVGGRRIRTKGINFSVMSREDISSVVSCVANEVGDGISGDQGIFIYFYGAGLVTDTHKEEMTDILRKFFHGASVECSSDLLAAARALWGDSPGIVAILGTGSNSCSYDGTRVTANVRPGGYILGDEGGGAALGRRFLADYIKNLTPGTLSERFREQYRLDYADIVNSVYKSPNPAGFLASFAPFIIEAAGKDGYCRSLVTENVRAFITRSLLSYRQGNEILEVGVAGSVGMACSRWLESIGKDYNVNFRKFMSSPVEALAGYHMDKNSGIL